MIIILFEIGYETSFVFSSKTEIVYFECDMKHNLKCPSSVFWRMLHGTENEFQFSPNLGRNVSLMIEYIVCISN